MREEPHSNDCIDIASYEQCGINKEKNEHNNSNDNINKKNPYKQRYEKKRKEKERKAKHSKGENERKTVPDENQRYNAKDSRIFIKFSTCKMLNALAYPVTRTHAYKRRKSAIHTMCLCVQPVASLRRFCVFAKIWCAK